MVFARAKQEGVNHKARGALDAQGSKCRILRGAGGSFRKRVYPDQDEGAEISWMQHDRRNKHSGTSAARCRDLPDVTKFIDSYVLLSPSLPCAGLLRDRHIAR
jgi:hypothetical protein